QEGVRYTAATGDYSWWTGSMFSGMPAYQVGGGSYRADRILAPFKDFLNRGPSHPAWIFIFYFVCFFMLMRSFSVERWMSVAGAVAVALSSYFIIIIGAGHGGKTISISYVTLVAAGFYLIFRKRYALGAAFTMFFTAMGFAIHPQMSYYIFLMIGVFFIAELWIHIREKRWKDLGIAILVFALSLGIGLGTGTAGIFANLEYASESVRGGQSDLVEDSPAGKEAPSRGLDIDYATEWSYGIGESLTLLIPGVRGGSSDYALSSRSALARTLTAEGHSEYAVSESCGHAPMYWGDQAYTAGGVYVGAVVCFLFLLGCMVVKGPYKWALLASAVFSLLLSWGGNFRWLTEFFFRHFPFYNKFRAVSSILIVAEIAMPLLGFLALKAIAEGTVKAKEARRKIIAAAALTGGICLVFALAGRSMFDFKGPQDWQFTSRISSSAYSALLSDRAALLVRDSWRSFAFIAAAAAALYLFTLKKLPYRWLVPVIGVLVLADLWPVDRRYFNDSAFVTAEDNSRSFGPTTLEKRLRLDKDPHFRVMNLTTDTFNDARTSYWLKSIGGYHAAKLRRYQDLIDTYLLDEYKPVLDMLNTKYFIYYDEERGEVRSRLNPDAQGNAWFVGKLNPAGSARAEMDALSEIDLRREAVFDSKFASQVPVTEPGIAPDASIRLTAYTPKQLDYEYSTSTPGTVVFSEIYYPYGWKASIDGTPAEHFRVNYTLRALNVPAGSHHITFLFDPDSVRRGDAIATVCVIIMYITLPALAVGALLRRRRTAKPDSGNETISQG
nr:YfhO family protein [Bacteroidales bacterium]